MGVPEFWRFNGKNWQILTLTNGEYAEQDRSPTFPIVEKTDLYQFLDLALRDEIAAETNFRQLIKQRIPAQP